MIQKEQALSAETLRSLDARDTATMRLTAAMAIIDCVRIVVAVERADAQGSSTAQGYIARDESMPLALSHALLLLRETLSATDTLICALQSDHSVAGAK